MRGSCRAVALCCSVPESVVHLSPRAGRGGCASVGCRVHVYVHRTTARSRSRRSERGRRGACERQRTEMSFRVTVEFSCPPCYFLLASFQTRTPGPATSRPRRRRAQADEPRELRRDSHQSVLSVPPLRVACCGSSFSRRTCPSYACSRGAACVPCRCDPHR